jgi:hypothetical protein
MHRLEPMSHTSVTLTVQYMNVRQRKIGTIIIQTVHILRHVTACIVRTLTHFHCPWAFSSTIQITFK